MISLSWMMHLSCATEILLRIRARDVQKQSGERSVSRQTKSPHSSYLPAILHHQDRWIDRSVGPCSLFFVIRKKEPNDGPIPPSSWCEDQKLSRMYQYHHLHGVRISHQLKYVEQTIKIYKSLLHNSKTFILFITYNKNH